MTYPPVIGLTGAQKSGKSNIATILHDLYGYEVIDFDSSILQTVQSLPQLVSGPTWLEAAFERAPEGKLLVIDGIFYADEFESIRDRGGEIWCATPEECLPLTPPQDHSYDHVLHSGSIYNLVDRVMNHLDGIPLE